MKTQAEIAMMYAERGLESRVTPIRDLPSFKGWTDDQIGAYLSEGTAPRIMTTRDRRAAVTLAAKAWMATEPGDDEADITLESVLLQNNVLYPLDTVEEIWSDAPETLMLRLESETLIEIDVESGNSLRGSADV